VRRAGVPGLGRREDPELGHVGDADDHEPGLAQAVHEIRRVVGVVAREEARGEVHAVALDRHVRLDGDRHAGVRPLVAGLDLVGRSQGLIGGHLHERVDRPVERLDPLDRRTHRLACRKLAPADQGGELGDRLGHQVVC
jgi:hypothetical protein